MSGNSEQEIKVMKFLCIILNFLVFFSIPLKSSEFTLNFREFPRSILNSCISFEFIKIFENSLPSFEVLNIGANPNLPMVNPSEIIK